MLMMLNLRVLLLCSLLLLSCCFTTIHAASYLQKITATSTGKCSENEVLIDGDLNAAGNTSIHLCVTLGGSDSGAVLTAIMPSLVASCAIPGYVSVNDTEDNNIVVNFNPDAPKLPLYLCVATGFDQSAGLTGLSVVANEKQCVNKSNFMIQNWNLERSTDIADPVYLCVAGINALPPRQIHLALTGAVAQMAISWSISGTNLFAADIDMNSYNPVCIVAPAQNTSDKTTFKGIATQYYQSHQLECVVTGLSAETEYVYQVGDRSAGLSEKYTFVTEPKRGDIDAAFQFLVIGDMGVSNSADTLVRLNQDKNRAETSFLIHVGDYSYADDRYVVGPNPLYEPITDQYMDSIQSLSTALPYMMAPGNHDGSCHASNNAYCPAELLNFTAYRHRFRMPFRESGGAHGMWYSYTYQNTHFISLSTETDYPDAPSQEQTDLGPRGGPFGDQLAWLQADLDAVDRTKTPWIIVYGHRPLYSSDGHDFPFLAKKRLREAVEEIFHAAAVDVYLCGHVHAYERSYPVYNNEVTAKNYEQPQATVHFVNGAAGNIEGHEHTYTDVQEYTAYTATHAFGYSEINIVNSTQLIYKFYDSNNGTVVDQVTINK